MIKTILSYFLMLSFLVGCSLTPQRMVNALPDLEGESAMLKGKWEGVIFIQSTKLNETLRIEIENDEVKVFERNSISLVWKELLPGNFKILPSKMASIIHMTHLGSDEDGVWSETWIILARPRSKHELEVEWIRTVKNFELPESNPDHLFSNSGTGIFKPY